MLPTILLRNYLKPMLTTPCNFSAIATRILLRQYFLDTNVLSNERLGEV